MPWTGTPSPLDLSGGAARGYAPGRRLLTSTFLTRSPLHCGWVWPVERRLVRSGLAGPLGGKVLSSLARPWGLEGLPGSVAVHGQTLAVPPGGYAWVNDRAAGDNLVMQFPRHRSVEVCGLSPAGHEEA